MVALSQVGGATAEQAQLAVLIYLELEKMSFVSVGYEAASGPKSVCRHRPPVGPALKSLRLSEVWSETARTIWVEPNGISAPSTDEVEERPLPVGIPDQIEDHVRLAGDRKGGDEQVHKATVLFGHRVRGHQRTDCFALSSQVRRRSCSRMTSASESRNLVLSPRAQYV